MLRESAKKKCVENVDLEKFFSIIVEIIYVIELKGIKHKTYK